MSEEVRAPGRRRVIDRAVTAVLMVAVLGWSLLYAALGPLFLRPVSTCGSDRFRCTAGVDVGVALASWGPIVVALTALAVVAVLAVRGRRTWVVPVCGAALVVGLQLLGQALVSSGVVPR